MKDQLKELQEIALSESVNLENLDDLEKFRVKYFGKKGLLTNLSKGLRDVAPEDRPLMGKLMNETRDAIEGALQVKEDAFKKAMAMENLIKEKIDVTLPGKRPEKGSIHPLIQIINELKAIFIGLGYESVDGPEIELAYYNFDALNTPENHPARDMKDTFYITEDIVLRTQTSPMQVRLMENRQPPLKVIAPGRVFRSDAVDATHSPLFHQMEGLCIGENISFGDLKGTLTTFCKELYGEDREVRFRPHNFPFTEPSAEVDVSCIACDGVGCRICSHTGWIEVLGAGMVHPNVLKMAGYDPDKVGGFAFGVGLERICMLKYGISDIRNFYENDVRFLSQFR